MKIIRNVAALGLAKTAYDQARKPENQVRIKNAVDALRGADQKKKSRSLRRTR